MNKRARSRTGEPPMRRALVSALPLGEAATCSPPSRDIRVSSGECSGSVGDIRTCAVREGLMTALATRPLVSSVSVYVRCDLQT